MPSAEERPRALAESASAAEPDDQLEGAVQPAFSDQQTLHKRTGLHGHLLLKGLMSAGDAFDDIRDQKNRRCHHTTAVWSLEP